MFLVWGRTIQPIPCFGWWDLARLLRSWVVWHRTKVGVCLRQKENPWRLKKGTTLSWSMETFTIFHIVRSHNPIPTVWGSTRCHDPWHGHGCGLRSFGQRPDDHLPTLKLVYGWFVPHLSVRLTPSESASMSRSLYLHPSGISWSTSALGWRTGGKIWDDRNRIALIPITKMGRQICQERHTYTIAKPFCCWFLIAVSGDCCKVPNRWLFIMTALLCRHCIPSCRSKPGFLFAKILIDHRSVSHAYVARFVGMEKIWRFNDSCRGSCGQVQWTSDTGSRRPDAWCCKRAVEE